MTYQNGISVRLVQTMLPKSKSPIVTAPQPSNSDSQSRARRLRVLIVDDDRDNADSLTMLVRLWGHDVRWEYGGLAALTSASVVRPDVLLLDVAMPKFGGCAVVERLRRQSQFDQTRIIAVSGYADAAHRALCRQAGFDDFLAKPLEVESLERLLILETKRLPGTPEPTPISRPK